MVHLQPNTKTKEKSFSPDERQAYKVLSQIKGDSLWAISIRRVCNKDSASEFRKLIEELRQANNDNPYLLLSIMGFEGYKYFKKIIEQEEE